MRWTIAFALILVATAAQAGDYGGGGGKHGHAGIDANDDGFITREEAKAHPRVAEHFDEVDANKDGQLDSAEMDAHHQKMHAAMHEKAEERWKAADKDGDGSLTKAEAEGSMPRLAQRFEELDANADGKVSPEELHEFRMKKRSSN
jgi:Ca2+-binding EF-hand superfamily protein